MPGVLNVGYAEAGPADGPPVILLHGWPYDIHSYADVAPLLAAAGYRVIVPFLRGYGTTRFLSDDTPRNGQQAALAVDVIALMDALEIEQGDPRRLRLGRAHGRHRRGALARALQGPGLGQRLPDRQPGRQPDAAAAAGRARLVVPVLLRHRARPSRLRQVPARFRQAHLAARLAEVGLRRRHVRAQRRRLRQPRPRRDRDPQLPLAARPGRGRAAIRRPGAAARRSPGHHRAHHHPRRRRQRRTAPGTRRLRGQVHGQVRAPDRSRAASGTTCRRKPRRPSPRRSSTSMASDRLKITLPAPVHDRRMCCQF